MKKLIDYLHAAAFICILLLAQYLASDAREQHQVSTAQLPSMDCPIENQCEFDQSEIAAE